MIYKTESFKWTMLSDNLTLQILTRTIYKFLAQRAFFANDIYFDFFQKDRINLYMVMMHKLRF